jgi:hypothetical protein
MATASRVYGAGYELVVRGLFLVPGSVRVWTTMQCGRDLRLSRIISPKERQVL